MGFWVFIILYYAPTANSSMTKEARIYNGEKTACSRSGAGKTRQPHVNE